MKIDSTLKTILVAWLLPLTLTVYAADKKPRSNSYCAYLFLLSELESDAEFKAKLTLIKQAGWTIEFDKVALKSGFFEGADFDHQYPAILEWEISDLKKSRQLMPTKLLSELRRAKNERKNIVVNPTSTNANATILALVEQAHYFETVDFVGFREFLQLEISQMNQRIISARLLEKAFLAVLSEKSAQKSLRSKSVSKSTIKEGIGALEVHFGLPHDIVQKLWEIEIPQRYKN